MHWKRTLFPFLLAVLAASTFALGCGGGGGGGGDDDPVDPGDGTTPAMDHTNLVLRDRLGNPIRSGSTEPYSPRQTCGTCHDVDAIANAYHFQQGRTDATGLVVMDDDYFGDGRFFLKSAGMYGKW
jgi:hypothetical protein